jgi:predicted RecA/RadA family phage recombinase
METQTGNILAFTAPYAVTPGDGALVGASFGVSTGTFALGARGTFDLSGVFELAKASAQAWAEGAAIYWDNSAKKCTTVSTANTLIGAAAAAAANPSSTGSVRLNGGAVPITSLLDGKADADHDHDAAYAAIDHDHDSAYLAIGAPPVLTGANTVWEDLRFPAQAINPPGNVDDADIEPATGCLLFDASATEVCMGVAQLPHAWKQGSAIRAHLHWTPTSTNTGNVYWRLDYQVKNIGETFDFSAGWTTANTLDAADGVSGKHQIHQLAEITMTDKTVSCMIHWKLSRIGGDGTDTYTADARLLEFDIHYEVDSMGSDEELTKA